MEEKRVPERGLGEVVDGIFMQQMTVFHETDFALLEIHLLRGSGLRLRV